MCLHIDLRYDREKLTSEVEIAAGKFERTKIYKCIICKKEFKVKW